MRAKALLPLVLSILQGKFNPESLSKPSPPFLIRQDGSRIISSVDPGDNETVDAIQLPEPTEEGLIAVIPVKGVLMKNGYWWQPGMKDIAQWFITSQKSENIDAVIFDTDTPGGSTDGVQEVVDAIAVRTKPLITFVDGCDASAGYEITCPADEIIAMNNTCFIGSIGTMFSALDIIPLLEKFGAKSYEEYADDSKFKNYEWRELEKGNAKPLKENLLKPLNDIFLNNVKQFRGDKIKDDVLSGQCVLSQLALEKGLIDSIGSFDYAVQRARALAGEKKSKSTSNSNSTMKKFIVATFPTIAAFLGMKEDGDLTEDHMKKVEGELATHNSVKNDRDNLKVQLDQSTKDLQAANTAKNDLQNKLTKAEASAEAWEKMAKEFGAKDSTEATVERGGKSDPPPASATTEEEKHKVINEPFDAELEKLGM